VQIAIRIHGRPAPQGSKDVGRRGQTIEQSIYLPAWLAAIRRDVFTAYKDRDLPPTALPFFRAGVGVVIEALTFFVHPESCVAAGTALPLGTPDIDKLLRATLDGLGGNRKGNARLYADDAQVIKIDNLSKQRATDGSGPGAFIVARDWES
jgi:Holliday junction resolvase RusA-like endonuclease